MRRSRRGKWWLAAAAIVVVVVAGALSGGHGRPRRDPALAASAPHVQRLAPPAPIPGYLLIADRGNGRMLLVDGAKHVIWRYPRPGAPLQMPFSFDDDTFFGPVADRIVSNQEDQHTIQVISFPAGRVIWRYGHVNERGSAPGYLNTPDDAYLLRSGLISVADAYNCRVIFIDPRTHRIVNAYGSYLRCHHDPPRSFGSVNGASPLPDNGTLISEINGSWVDDIGPNGALRWAVQAPVSYPSDPQLLSPNRILIADYAHPGAALIMSRTGHVIWKYAPRRPGRARPPVARDADRARSDRDQRRLPRPRRAGEHQQAPDRLAVRAHGLTGNRPRLPAHAGRPRPAHSCRCVSRARSAKPSSRRAAGT
jgi:hypothetical protein